MIDPVNVPRNIMTIVNASKASWYELDQLLGVGDLYDLIEIVLISSHNQNVAEKAARREEPS